MSATRALQPLGGMIDVARPYHEEPSNRYCEDLQAVQEEGNIIIVRINCITAPNLVSELVPVGGVLASLLQMPELVNIKPYPESQSLLSVL